MDRRQRGAGRWGDSRSVMPSDVLGGTRNTIPVSRRAESLEGTGAWEGPTNAEFLVTAAHEAAVNVSL